MPNQVVVLENPRAQELREAIDDFFADRALDDLLLWYFAGHGIKDEAGRLHLITSDSRTNRLPSTSVSAEFVRDQVDRTRSRRIVLLLDCCYAGAFPAGLQPRAASALDLDGRLNGRGSVVISASTALEYAFEPSGEGLDQLGSPPASVFSAALIEGLRTGAADLDGDGLIGVAELYQYVSQQVLATGRPQTPTMLGSIQGDVHLARSGRPIQPALPEQKDLPPEVQSAIASGLTSVRLGVVEVLGGLAIDSHSPHRTAALTALTLLATEDDSRRVAEAARAALPEPESANSWPPRIPASEQEIRSVAAATSPPTGPGRRLRAKSTVGKGFERSVLDVASGCRC